MAPRVLVSAEEARRRLGDVPADKVFWCRDGRVFHNLAELEQGLNNMDEATFQHHVPGDHNDFTNWVRDVVGDQTPARRLSRCHTPASSATEVRRRLKWLRGKA